ncbi:MAG: PaREP1 family protein [Thaumarchaeota archaeon]|jgi:hypothetical protein|nr:PaREP1 family protein [Candidatus Terraquivivens yellowstonensis]
MNEGSTLIFIDYFEDGVIEKPRTRIVENTTIVTTESGRRLAGWNIGSVEEPRLEGYSARLLYSLSELADEWPEIVKIMGKLSRREKLTEKDEMWVNGLAEATGWDRDAILDELMNMVVDPSERAKRYKELHKEYFEEAKKLKEKGDLRQAGEKLWGAVTALIKLYAAIKNVFIPHWGRGKIDNFIASNVEDKYKDLFRSLLDNAEALHENFYEGDLSDEAFEERWKKILELLKTAREIIIKRFSK